MDFKRFSGLVDTRLASTTIHNKKFIQTTKSHLLYGKIISFSYYFIIVSLSNIKLYTKINEYGVYLIEYNIIFIFAIYKMNISYIFRL